MQKLFETIFPFTILLVIATMALPRAANNLAVGIHIIAFLFSFRFGDLKYLKKNKPGIAGIALLMLYGIGLLYTENLHEGKRSFESLAPLLIFPITMLGIKNVSALFVNRLPDHYNIMMLATTLTALLIALARTISSGLYYTNPVNGIIQNNFMFDRLSFGIGIHPGYLSLFVAFSILILITQVADHHHPKKKRIFKGLLIMYFIVVLVLLKSAMIAMVLGVCLLYYVFFELPKNLAGKTRISILIITPLILVASFLIVSLKIDFNEKLFQYDKSWMPPEGHWNSVNLRLALFDVGWQASNDHAPFGVGTGDGEDALKVYYQDQGFEYAIMHHYHPHNQYLFTYLTIGIPGLIVLVILFVMIMKSAFRMNNIHYIFLAILMIGFCFTEIPLMRNKSLVFFILFVSYFEYRNIFQKTFAATETTPSS